LNNRWALVNCIEGIFDLSRLPLVNVHDVAVLPGYRGHGVGEKDAVASNPARERGACKMTLEVLQGNAGAGEALPARGF
jgi:GNAT superfamily N-acetyltransferase